MLFELILLFFLFIFQLSSLFRIFIIFFTGFSNLFRLIFRFIEGVVNLLERRVIWKKIFNDKNLN
jgi:hypothetical protein